MRVRKKPGNNTTAMALSNDWIQKIRQASASDPAMQTLQKAIQEGWPLKKSEVPEIIWPYFGIRDELVLEGELVFKGQRLVVPVM